MALYDVPVHTGYKILSHTSTRRFAKNGFSQVGNTILPSHPINPSSVMRSSIYNKNLSGISEAGYGRRFPFYGLSYAGAGSPRSSLRYAGAGSPRASLAYAGAGSPRTSLRDAYINDNLPPGSLGKVGIPGRQNSIRGLADDTPVPADTGVMEGPAAPSADTSGSLWSTLTSGFSTLFSTTAATAVSAGTLSANKAVADAINGSPSTSQQIVTAARTATNPKSILGISVDTLMIGGLIAGAYYVLRK